MINIIEIYKKMKDENYIKKLKRIFIENILNEEQKYKSNKFQEYINEKTSKTLNNLVTKYLTQVIVNPQEKDKSALSWLKSKTNKIIRTKGEKFFLLMLLSKISPDQIEKIINYKRPPTFIKCKDSSTIKGEDIENKKNIILILPDRECLKIKAEDEFELVFPYTSKNILYVNNNRKTKSGIVKLSSINYNYSYNHEKGFQKKLIKLHSIVIHNKNVSIILCIDTYSYRKRYGGRGASYYVKIDIKKDKNNKLKAKLSRNSELENL